MWDTGLEYHLWTTPHCATTTCGGCEVVNTLLVKWQWLEDEGEWRRAIFKEEQKQRLANLDMWLATL
jgi:hypothetical protein